MSATYSTRSNAMRAIKAAVARGEYTLADVTIEKLDGDRVRVTIAGQETDEVPARQLDEVTQDETTETQAQDTTTEDTQAQDEPQAVDDEAVAAAMEHDTMAARLREATLPEMAVDEVSAEDTTTEPQDAAQVPEGWAVIDTSTEDTTTTETQETATQTADEPQTDDTQAAARAVLSRWLLDTWSLREDIAQDHAANAVAALAAAGLLAKPAKRATRTPRAASPGVTGEAQPRLTKEAKAAALAAAQQGVLPCLPDLTAPAHAGYRPMMGRIAALVERGDVSALRSFPIEPKCSTRIKMCRYIDLAITALEVQQAQRDAA